MTDVMPASIHPTQDIIAPIKGGGSTTRFQHSQENWAILVDWFSASEFSKAKLAFLLSIGG